MRQELEIEISPTMESVLSLRTVEFLRVSLGLTARATRRAPPVTPPPVETPAGGTSARRARRWSSGVVAQHRPAAAVRDRRRERARAHRRSAGHRAARAGAADDPAGPELGWPGRHVGVAGGRRSGVGAAAGGTRRVRDRARARWPRSCGPAARTPAHEHGPQRPRGRPRALRPRRRPRPHQPQLVGAPRRSRWHHAPRGAPSSPSCACRRRPSPRGASVSWRRPPASSGAF